MLKKISLTLFMLTAGVLARAQSADDVYNKYIDFNLAKLQDEEDKAFTLAGQIMPDTAMLPAKARVSFYNSIAKLYEDDNQGAKAIEFYQRVISALPGYYVAHRALGYLYIKDIPTKAVNMTDIDAAYMAKAKNALPHLEKAQACDPDDDTLALIKTLYKNINDLQDLKTLDTRLKVLKSNCLDIVSDN